MRELQEQQEQQDKACPERAEAEKAEGEMHDEGLWEGCLRAFASVLCCSGQRAMKGPGYAEVLCGVWPRQHVASQQGDAVDEMQLQPPATSGGSPANSHGSTEGSE